MNLLIVEDDEDTASFLKFIMEQESFNVRSASDIAQARASLKDFRPDLILLDRTLPDADGVVFCRELKRDPEFSFIPVVFVSARKDPAEVAEGLESGGADYVTKPFGFVELMARVQTVLRRLPGDRFARV